MRVTAVTLDIVHSPNVCIAMISISVVHSPNVCILECLILGIITVESLLTRGLD